MSLLLVTLLCLAAAPVEAQQGSGRPAIVIPRVERPPTLKDFAGMRPNREMAGQLGRVERFIQQEPSDGQPASQRTEVYFGYDDKNLYLIYVCFDSEPGKVRARMGRREDIFKDDTVEVMLDTFNDQRRAYGFATNPYGIQWDALWTEAQGFDQSFDTLWHSEGRLTDQGYLVRMVIPFKSLRFSNETQQTWGVIFLREIPRHNEKAFWPYVSSRREGRLSQAGTATGLDNISPGRNIQFIPYGAFRSFRAVDLRDEDHPQFVRDNADPDAGLDAKVILKDSLVLDLALNPDFSQVESDEPQVTVNQRFEVFFPEKRPFFLENAGFFQTPIDLVFTRRIADPQWGARLTGKLGPYALGAFVMDDESPGESVPVHDPLADKRALFGVVRVSRDIFRQSTLGFIYTDREFEEEYNRVGGIDGRLKLGENWVAEFQGVTSWTRQREDDGSLTVLAGPAYDFQLSRSGRSFTYTFEYNDRSPGFRTETGFVPRTDIRRVENFARYTFWPQDKAIINWGPELFIERIYDHDGTRLDWQVSPQIEVQMAGRTEFGAFYNAARERLRPEDFDGLTRNLDFSQPGYGFFFESSYFSQVTLSGFVGRGKRINFAPPQGQEPFLARETPAELNLTVLPTNALRIDNTYLLSRLVQRGTGVNIFNNHIIRSRWNYQFTRELSLRVILQYDTTLANPELTSLQTRKNLNADFLLTYLLHPGTALYIGYNSNAQNLSPDLFLCRGSGSARAGCPDLAADSTALLRPRNRLINDAKQFFIKFSYLYRF